MAGNSGKVGGAAAGDSDSIEGGVAGDSGSVGDGFKNIDKTKLRIQQYGSVHQPYIVDKDRVK